MIHQELPWNYREKLYGVTHELCRITDLFSLVWLKTQAHYGSGSDLVPMPFGYVPFFNFPGAHILAKNSFSILNGSKFQFLKICFHYIIQNCKYSFYILRAILWKPKWFWFLSHVMFFFTTRTLQEMFLAIFKILF